MKSSNQTINHAPGQMAGGKTREVNKMKKSLRELCHAANIEFIRTHGHKALVRIGDGLGGKIKLVSRQWLLNAIDELDYYREVKK